MKGWSPFTKVKTEAPPKTTTSKKRAGLFRRGSETTTKTTYNPSGEKTSSASKTKTTRSLFGRIFGKGKYKGPVTHRTTQYKDDKPVQQASSVGFQ